MNTDIFTTLNHNLSTISLSSKKIFEILHEGMIYAGEAGVIAYESQYDFTQINKFIDELNKLCIGEPIPYELFLYSIRVNINALKTCVLTNITLSYNPVDKILYEPLLLSINNYIKINDHLITNYIHDSYVSEFDDDTVSVVSNDTTQEEEDSITVIDTTINIIEED